MEHPAPDDHVVDPAGDAVPPARAGDAVPPAHAGAPRPARAAADVPVLPDQTVDDTDRGWGEWAGTDDDRLLRERPPHWE